MIAVPNDPAGRARAAKAIKRHDKIARQLERAIAHQQDLRGKYFAIKDHGTDKAVALQHDLLRAGAAVRALERKLGEPR